MGSNAFAWDSAQYLKFKKERTQPAIDLAARLPEPGADGGEGMRLLDIGCGPGNSTAQLRARYPKASILGVDNSQDMIDRATAEHPDIDFRLCDVSTRLDELPGGFDVVFSNACIQWVPDHRTLIPALLGHLRHGGTLAVQTPMNYEEPIHRIIGEVTTSEEWRPFFPHPRVFHNLRPGDYYALLGEHAAGFSIWMTTYMHVMPSHQAIMDWYRGTGLRPYLSRLDDGHRARFEREILDRVTQAYPEQPDGRIIFPFPRFFFTATAR